jgi:hypothetical protein
MESGFIVPLQKLSEMKRKVGTSRTLTAHTLKLFSLSLYVRFAGIFTSLLIACSSQN